MNYMGVDRLKLRSAQLDDVFNEFTYHLSTRADLESQITLALGCWLYRLTRMFILAALRRVGHRRKIGL